MAVDSVIQSGARAGAPAAGAAEIARGRAQKSKNGFTVGFATAAAAAAAAAAGDEGKGSGRGRPQSSVRNARSDSGIAKGCSGSGGGE